MGMAHAYDPYHDVYRQMKSFWSCAVKHHEHLTREGAMACVRQTQPDRFGPAKVRVYGPGFDEGLPPEAKGVDSASNAESAASRAQGDVWEPRWARPREEDFYLDPNGEWVYRWAEERWVLQPSSPYPVLESRLCSRTDAHGPHYYDAAPATAREWTRRFCTGLPLASPAQGDDAPKEFPCSGCGCSLHECAETQAYAENGEGYPCCAVCRHDGPSSLSPDSVSEPMVYKCLECRWSGEHPIFGLEKAWWECPECGRTYSLPHPRADASQVEPSVPSSDDASVTVAGLVSALNRLAISGGHYRAWGDHGEELDEDLQHARDTLHAYQQYGVPKSSEERERKLVEALSDIANYVHTNLTIKPTNVMRSRARLALAAWDKAEEVPTGSAE